LKDERDEQPVWVQHITVKDRQDGDQEGYENEKNHAYDNCVVNAGFDIPATFGMLYCWRRPLSLVLANSSMASSVSSGFGVFNALANSGSSASGTAISRPY